MVLSEETLAKLRRMFGLNLYEVRIWTALLSRGKSTAGELSEIANVPRSRTYDILESLEKKGFVMMKMGKPIQYLAIPPNEVIERAKANLEKEKKMKEKMLDELKKSKEMSELQLLFKQGIEYIDPLDLSGVVRGRENIYARLESMINNSKKHVSIVVPPSEVKDKFEAVKKAIEKAKKRGVKVNIITKSTPENKDLIQAVAKMANIKEKDLNARIAIADNKQVLFMLLPHEEVHPKYDVGVWVQSELFANALNKMIGQ